MIEVCLRGAIWGNARVGQQAHKLYFYELVHMKATPDSAGRLRRALNRPSLEGFDLGPRRIQK